MSRVVLQIVVDLFPRPAGRKHTGGGERIERLSTGEVRRKPSWPRRTDQRELDAAREMHKEGRTGVRAFQHAQGIA